MPIHAPCAPAARTAARTTAAADAAGRHDRQANRVEYDLEERQGSDAAGVSARLGALRDDDVHACSLGGERARAILHLRAHADARVAQARYVPHRITEGQRHGEGPRRHGGVEQLRPGLQGPHHEPDSELPTACRSARFGRVALELVDGLLARDADHP